MSGILGAAAAAGQLTSAVSAVGNIASIGGRIASAGSALADGSFSLAAPNGLGVWAQFLQPASWREITFAVRSSRIIRGRRVAVHEYPYKDVVWVEDLGRGMRQVTFSGFLTGDNVYGKRDAFAAACETAGPGTLVHPSIGSMQASLVSFAAGESFERGRVVEIELSFIESGQDQPLFPSVLASTQAGTLAQAVSADLAAAADFAADVSGALAFGSSVANAAIQTVVGWTRLATQAVSDAGLISAAVTGLPGIFGGRYATGSSGTTQPPGTTASTALLALASARAQVAADVAAVEPAGAANIPASVQQIAADVLVTAINPADQVRLLASLAVYDPAVSQDTAPIGAAIAEVQSASGAVCRRAALAALAQATAAYVPSSYNDAVAVLDLVTGLLDTEIVAAADAGDNNSYLAFRALRSAVAQDMVARGAQLPKLMTVTRGRSLPALVLAYQLYGDATRCDDLAARADAPAPLFMPLQFQALGS